MFILTFLSKTKVVIMSAILSNTDELKVDYFICSHTLK